MEAKTSTDQGDKENIQRKNLNRCSSHSAAPRSLGHCSYFGCENRSYSPSGRKTKYHFFKVPLQNPERTQWCNRMGKREGKDGFKVTKNTKCCDNHFRPDEITHVPGGTRWSLKLNATPIKVGCKPSDLDGLKRKQPADRVIDSRDNSKRQCFVDTVWSCSTEKYYQPKPLSRIAVNAVKNAYIVLKEENKELKSKVKALQKTIEDKELQLNKKTFGVNIIENNTELCRHYTGLPDFDRVKACLKFLDVGEKGENVIMKGSKGTGSTGRPRCLSVENQFLLALVKLRRGFSNAHCAFLFDCSESTVVNVFSSWLNYMFLKFTVLPIWISREEINTSMPCSFKAAFPRTRAIIDCTEIFVEAPESLHLRSMYYSDYKHHNTYKAFISITPAGSLSFVSELFPGSVSDREIVERCGFLRQEMWDKGDEVMADKGFTIRDLLGPLGVKLNMPHFLEDNLQFTTNQVCFNQKISSLRIHVERYISRIKNFGIFDKPIPVTMHGSANQIFTVCTFLVMFQDPIISVK